METQNSGEEPHGKLNTPKEIEESIFYRTITLADVLLAMNTDMDFVVDCNGHFLKIHGADETGITYYEGTGIYWNLKETFENQSDEFKQFLHNLLKD